MTRKQLLALFAVLALLAVGTTSCKNEELKSDVEDLLEELDEQREFALDYEVKAGMGGGVTVDDFELTISQFGEEFVTFTADKIKIDAMEMGSMGFPEVLKLEVKGLTPEIDKDFMAYMPAEYKDLIDKSMSVVVDYALDDDVFKVKTWKMMVDDVGSVEATLELVDVNLRREEASIKKGWGKYTVHKKFRDDFKSLLEDYAEEMEDDLDDIDDKDLRKLAEKVVDFLKDPKSIEFSMNPDDPVEFDELERLDEDEVVDTLGLKIK